MKAGIYRYTFNESVSMPEAEATLQLAILAAESLFGEATVRLSAGYTIDEDKRVCVLDATNEVGRSICQIYTGYVTHEFGADAFRVRQVEAAQREPAEVAA